MFENGLDIKYVLLIVIIVAVGLFFYFPLDDSGTTDISEDKMEDKAPAAGTQTPTNTQTVSTPTNIEILADKDEVVVSYTNSGFVPKVVTIEQAKTLRFVNNSIYAMRVMTDEHPSHQQYKELRQPSSVGAGGEYLISPIKVGHWTFHNDGNLSHTGAVTVVPQSR